MRVRNPAYFTKQLVILLENINTSLQKLISPFLKQSEDEYRSKTSADEAQIISFAENLERVLKNPHTINLHQLRQVLQSIGQISFVEDHLLRVQLTYTLHFIEAELSQQQQERTEFIENEEIQLALLSSYEAAKQETDKEDMELESVTQSMQIDTSTEDSLTQLVHRFGLRANNQLPSNSSFQTKAQEPIKSRRP